MANNQDNINITQELGSKIRTIREGKGKTQEDIAHDAGLDYSFYNEIENGKRNPSVKTLEAIAKALSLTIKDLFE